jgi:hypothetical protein
MRRIADGKGSETSVSRRCAWREISDSAKAGSPSHNSLKLILQKRFPDHGKAVTVRTLAQRLESP